MTRSGFLSEWNPCSIQTPWGLICPAVRMLLWWNLSPGSCKCLARGTNDKRFGWVKEVIEQLERFMWHSSGEYWGEEGWKQHFFVQSFPAHTDEGGAFNQHWHTILTLHDHFSENARLLSCHFSPRCSLISACNYTISVKILSLYLCLSSCLCF